VVTLLANCQLMTYIRITINRKLTIIRQIKLCSHPFVMDQPDYLSVCFKIT